MYNICRFFVWLFYCQAVELDYHGDLYGVCRLTRWHRGEHVYCTHEDAVKARKK